MRVAMIILCGAALLAACGPTREESWSSYYYGTQRRSAAGIEYGKDYPQDNDDSYVLPSGTWEDDQVPQHDKNW